MDEAKPFKQRSNIGSRVTREGHARFWERPEVKFLRATRHYSFGLNLMLIGRFASSRTHLEESLAHYDPISHRSLVHQAGFHPQNNAQALLGIALFCLGYPDQAVARNSAGIAEARRLAHPPSLAVSLANNTTLLWLVGDDGALKECVDELVAVATERGFPSGGAVGMMFRGWLEVKGGDVAEGMSLLRSGFRNYRATGAGTSMPRFLLLLARACEIAGQIEEAVTLLDDALQTVERSGGRSFAAELYNRKGQLVLLQGHAEAAEELDRKALSIAREQEAKLWELRAAVSLARLRRDQGRRAAARDLLAPIYGWFTEGIATPDLKEAKALLDELDA